MPRDTGRVSQNCNAAYMYVCPLFENGDTSLASITGPTSILCNLLEHLTTTNVVSHMYQYNRCGSRISGKGVYNGVGVQYAEFILFLLKYPVKIK